MLSNFQVLLNSMKLHDEKELSLAEENNKQKEKYRQEMIEAQEELSQVNEYLRLIGLVQDITCRKANEFKEGRLTELIERAETVLDLAFPTEQFGIDISVDRRYNEDTASLLIGPKRVDRSQWFSPVTENGGFVQQLIAVALIVSICLMCDAKFIFLDEMFCSGDPVSVGNIAPFLNSIMDNKIQLTVIEHKPTLYEDIKRREFHLAKDREVNQNVKLLKVEDIDV